VAGAGAAGGAASVLFALVTDVPIGAAIRTVAIVFLGTFAGLVGVYVLANSDRKDVVRCLVFAFLCGFSWKPLLEAGQVYVQTVTKQAGAVQQASKVDAETASLEKATSSDTTQLAATIRNVGASAEAANTKLPSVTTRAAREKVSASTTKAIDAIGTVGAKAPATASENLLTLGSAAAASGDTANARRAVLHLDRLAATAPPLQRRLYESRAATLRGRLMLRP